MMKNIIVIVIIFLTTTIGNTVIAQKLTVENFDEWLVMTDAFH